MTFSMIPFLRKEKGFQKEDTAFEEFIWARRRVDRSLVESDMPAALK